LPHASAVFLLGIVFGPEDGGYFSSETSDKLSRKYSSLKPGDKKSCNFRNAGFERTQMLDDFQNSNKNSTFLDVT
jgi:hypothetical protein